MIVKVKLQDYEVKGIKKYLKSLGDTDTSKAAIQSYIQGEINAILQSCAVGDYIECPTNEQS